MVRPDLHLPPSFSAWLSPFLAGLSHQKLSLHGLLARRDVMLDP